MKTKWVCPICSSTNICEKTERTRCFVCGSYHEESPYVSKSSYIPERYDLKLADASVTRHGVGGKMKNFMKKFKFSFRLTEADSPKRKIIDWKIEHSPLDSKEAYVEARPIYEEVSDSILDVDTPEDTKSDRDSTERIEKSKHIAATTISGGLSEDIEPWLEHRVNFDFFKLHSTGCVNIKKENIHGKKCYKLLYKNGSEKILPLTSMKMIGYLVEDSSEIYSEKTSARRVRSFVPWSEHKIVFDMEKLNETGCVNVEQTEVNGNKCYKLSYQNGMDRIMNVSNLKLMGYVRDV